MKRNTNTKLPALKLCKETLRNLSDADLRGVAGGQGTTVVSGGGNGCGPHPPVHEPVQKQ